MVVAATKNRLGGSGQCNASAREIKHGAIMGFETECVSPAVNTGCCLQVHRAYVLSGTHRGVLTGDPEGPGGPLGPMGPWGEDT